MIAIPCVEIRQGACVRPAGLIGSNVGVWDDALAVVRGWGLSGFRRVHLVDADAVAGNGSNAALVEEIIRDGAVDVETCDGAQSVEQIERLIDAGAIRVALGTRALDEPDWLIYAAELFPGLLIVTANVRARRVVTRGWVRSLPHDILDVADDLNDLPLGGLLVKSTPDAQRTGVELSLLEDIAEACEFPVIAAGGVSTIGDLRALDNRGVSAVLLGDLLYNGSIDPHGVATEFSE
jgi:Phosphoribosylformimino-5-aminoimidazole carboxamide ribonucleotide (ProFAR) isomerase